jgi:hypothetical protein
MVAAIITMSEDRVKAGRGPYVRVVQATTTFRPRNLTYRASPAGYYAAPYAGKLLLRLLRT